MGRPSCIITGIRARAIRVLGESQIFLVSVCVVGDVLMTGQGYSREGGRACGTDAGGEGEAVMCCGCRMGGFIESQSFE